MNEGAVRAELVDRAYSMFERGYSSGGAGNISARLEDGSFIITPTNSSFGDLEADSLSKLDAKGNWVSGDKPTKEVAMHLAMYRNRPTCHAIVHLHSPWLTALSCMPNLDRENCLPPLTPYYVMKIGRLPVVEYFPPGDDRISQEIDKLAKKHNSILLANHGPVVGGETLRQAFFNAEELEDTARLYLILLPHGFTTLNEVQVQELEKRYPRM
ncbi:aldolase [Xenorhabdus szentirmaii]|uniref:3-oxo-tetronate 4-phosphate decarboxylase n=2 Tax=Xenorhabdus szentirmaii TaxID=290112 RepID=W1IV10_9GAMM|nr:MULTISPECIES: aldolase [Xenorhabdus]MBD2781994.1 aldolase [Xenorhabdus sp. 38]MBD2791134.1 aldolase [Xenorhabdus sp. CUL]MBD2799604.1 aldolase [Xenorhabdus sp. M]MBD2805638.1 aldolase [Xenorhabdus sp. ZM]MBD2821039.1 aldolase [Xenorhabdus sp. 42]